MNMFTPTIMLANLVDSFTPLIKSTVKRRTITIAGMFIATGILSNKYGIWVCGSKPNLSQYDSIYLKSVLSHNG